MSAGTRLDLVIHVDGGARGNPGPAGAGVMIRVAEGPAIFEAGYFLGRQTNNFAEYVALIRGLERATQLGAASVLVRSDSELLVRQMTGDYQVKAPALRTLHLQAQTLLLRLPRWSIEHVRREHNQRADELANLAMDQGRDVIVLDASGAAPPPAPIPAAAEPALPKTPKIDARRGATHGNGQTADPPATRPAALAEVRLTVATRPSPKHCAVAEHMGAEMLVGRALPAGLCTYAAHAVLPTVIAILGTDADELRGVPTMTVRCSKPGCGAVFNLTPVLADVDHRRTRHP